MSYSEDKLYEVFEEVQKLGIKAEFDEQLKKMQSQEKHKHKRIYEKWEYALYRIQGGKPKERY
jgi:hypothetical protein